MALTIVQVVARFKADVGQALSAATIEKVCGYLGYRFRQRILGPVNLVHIFLLQVLHGNVACTALPRLANLSFTDEAYCQARKRLPLALFEELLQHVCDALFPQVHTTNRWRGHRTWMADGTSFSMPDTPTLQAHFGQPGGQAKGCGFPTAHLLALFHAGTGLLLKVVASPLRTHDMRYAMTLHPELDAGDILIADRGFASFAHLALLARRRLHGLFRCHQRQIVDFTVRRPHAESRKAAKGMPRSRYLRRLGRQDQLVEYPKPTSRPRWLTADAYARLPETLQVRELRFLTPQRGYRPRVITLVTTLLDPVAYPAPDLAELYRSRWQVELNFRHLKTTMGMEVLHCKSVNGVLKELHIFALVYNLVRLVMLEACLRQDVPLDRISFIDALRWLQHAGSGTVLEALLINPLRRDRLQPRVLKRRRKEYCLMTKPRPLLKQRLLRQKLAA
jgi:hypothetical protein